MRRADKQRLIQQIFPVAGELADGNDFRLQGMRSPPGAGQDHRVALSEVAGAANFNRHKAAWIERLDQPEAGFLIVAQGVPGDGAAGGIDHPYLFRLDDQVADGQDQAAFADDDAVALAFGAQRRRREGVFGYICAQRHHGRQHPVEIKRQGRRVRLKFNRDFRGRVDHC